MRLKTLPKIKAKHPKKLAKYLLVIAFIAAIPTVAYFSAQELFYSSRVKITVTERNSNKPVRNHRLVFQTLCDPTPCKPEILAEVRTNFLGHAAISTKQMTESFEIVTDGYQTDGPWLKRPGSLFFSRQYDDRDFYSVNLSQSELTIKLAPSGQ